MGHGKMHRSHACALVLSCCFVPCSHTSCASHAPARVIRPPAEPACALWCSGTKSAESCSGLTCCHLVDARASGVPCLHARLHAYCSALKWSLDLLAGHHGGRDAVGPLGGCVRAAGGLFRHGRLHVRVWACQRWVAQLCGAGPCAPMAQCQALLCHGDQGHDGADYSKPVWGRVHQGYGCLCL